MTGIAGLEQSKRALQDLQGGSSARSAVRTYEVDTVMGETDDKDNLAGFEIWNDEQLDETMQQPINDNDLRSESTAGETLSAVHSAHERDATDVLSPRRGEKRTLTESDLATGNAIAPEAEQGVILSADAETEDAGPAMVEAPATKKQKRSHFNSNKDETSSQEQINRHEIEVREARAGKARDQSAAEVGEHGASFNREALSTEDRLLHLEQDHQDLIAAYQQLFDEKYSLQDKWHRLNEKTAGLEEQNRGHISRNKYLNTYADKLEEMLRAADLRPHDSTNANAHTKAGKYSSREPQASADSSPKKPAGLAAKQPSWEELEHQAFSTDGMDAVLDDDCNSASEFDAEGREAVHDQNWTSEYDAEEQAAILMSIQSDATSTSNGEGHGEDPGRDKEGDTEGDTKPGYD